MFLRVRIFSVVSFTSRHDGTVIYDSPNIKKDLQRLFRQCVRVLTRCCALLDTYATRVTSRTVGSLLWSVVRDGLASGNDLIGCPQMRDCPRRGSHVAKLRDRTGSDEMKSMLLRRDSLDVTCSAWIRKLLCRMTRYLRMRCEKNMSQRIFTKIRGNVSRFHGVGMLRSRGV